MKIQLFKINSNLNLFGVFFVKEPSIRMTTFSKELTVDKQHTQHFSWDYQGRVLSVIN